MNLAVALSLSLLAAEPEGVQFFDGTWKAATEEAKKTNKLLFADFSTQW